MHLDCLVIAPHPDDAELGMGGAILKFKSEGGRVGVLDLTNGEPTPHGSPEIRAGKRRKPARFWGWIGARTWGCRTAGSKPPWRLDTNSRP